MTETAAQSSGDIRVDQRLSPMHSAFAERRALLEADLAARAQALLEGFDRRRDELLARCGERVAQAIAREEVNRG